MKNIINLTNKNIVLATPLILFTLISTVYTAMIMNRGIVFTLFGVGLLGLMYAVFISGWGYMLKKVVTEPQREDSNMLFAEFPEGVGRYFYSSIGVIVIFFLLSLSLLIGALIFGTKFIGNPNVTQTAFAQAMTTPEALKAFLLSLSNEQLIQLNKWAMLILGTITGTYYLLILYIPALFFKTKNPFKALFIGLKDLFSKKILKTTLIYLIIFVLYSFISIISALCASNPILNFVTMLLNFYFITFVSIWIMDYYYNNFVQSHLGQNIDTIIL